MITVSRSIALSKVNMLSVCQHAPERQCVSLSASFTAKTADENFQQDSISIQLTREHIPEIKDLLRELGKLDR